MIYGQSLKSKLTSPTILKIFLLALKGLELKDLFTELRFEKPVLHDPVKNRLSAKHRCIKCPALGAQEDL